MATLMATLETQYKNWLKKNEPITYSEWLEKFSEIYHLDKLKEPTMENKQTAVEWLQNKLPSLFEHDDNDFYKKLFEQAKQIEKEQIIDAYTHDRFLLKITAEQYYQETYNKS